MQNRAVSKDTMEFEEVVVTSKALLLVGRCTPSLAMRMAPARAVLMRGLAANLAGKGWRHVGQVFLPLLAHLVKQPRQKLCWQGAWCKHYAISMDCQACLQHADLSSSD